MNELFKFGYELATEPLGLPIEWYWEYLVLGIIEIIACKTAYYNVGKLYRDHQISGKTEGSLIHW